MFLQNQSGGERGRHLLPACLVASAALHAAVVVVVPSPGAVEQSAPPQVLEVVLVQSEPARPLPPAPEEPLPAPRPRSRAAAHPLPAAEPSRRMETPPPPVLALPEPAAAAEPAFVVPQAPEKRAPAAEPRTEVASVAPTPASFSAAYLRNPAPRYPLEARRSGEQGTVTLRVLVTREGHAARVDVEKSSGSARLDAAALEAVKAWRFVPARKGQEAIESSVLVPIVFRLEGAS